MRRQREPAETGPALTPVNAARLMKASNGLIVGSSMKFGGKWENAVDPERVEELVESVWG